MKQSAAKLNQGRKLLPTFQRNQSMLLLLYRSLCFLLSSLPSFSFFKSVVSSFFTPEAFPFVDNLALSENSFLIEIFLTQSPHPVGSVFARWGQGINLISLRHDSLSNRLRQLHRPLIFFALGPWVISHMAVLNPFFSWLMCF